MKLSTRSRYGFRAALELAVEYGGEPLQIKTMAQRESISSKYLEQIMAILKASGFIRSVRGPRGGYMLTRPPSTIKLSEVFKALEGAVVDLDCLEHPEYCPRCSGCVTRQVWAQMQQAMIDVLESMTLQDLVDKIESEDENVDYQI